MTAAVYYVYGRMKDNQVWSLAAHEWSLAAASVWAAAVVGEDGTWNQTLVSGQSRPPGPEVPPDYVRPQPGPPARRSGDDVRAEWRRAKAEWRAKTGKH